MRVNHSFRISDLSSAVSLLLILGVVVLVYYPGLKGGFIFDDYPNLEDLGFYGGVVDFETFKNFVFNGFSGPLGRPVSMASFLLDDNKWPTNPEWFKTTNLKIHLLTGLVLCWATLNLLRVYRFSCDERPLIWCALLSSAIWMLHPYMVSTTLYVVQRMAQLAALFVFAGVAGYMHGRLLLMRGQIRSGYLWMSCSLACGTLLAVFSKENGILLPFLVLMIEFCLPKPNVALLWWWRVVFLWLPSCAVIVILAKEINFSADAWPNRAFTQPERLLTEARILWEYLYHLYIPRIEGRGLFQDGYQFSHNLLAPPITLIAWVTLAILLVLAVKFRHRFPFLCLCFLFFLVGHLIESTVLGLELYFEHRNYLASAFLFLPLAMLLVNLTQKTKLWVPILGSVLLMGTLSLLTWERAKLWSNTENLQLYWAASTPESPRAVSKIGSALLNSGDLSGAISYMEKAIDAHPQSSFLNVSLLLIKMHAKTAALSDFISSANRLGTQSFDAQTIVGIRRLVDSAVEINSQPYLNGALVLLQSTESNSKFMNVYTFKKLAPYLKGRLYISLKEYNLAYLEFKKAIPMYSETDASLGMIAEIASANRPVEALLLLKQAEELFRVQPDATLRRSRSVYESEFLRLYSILKSDLAARGVSLVDDSSNKEGKNNDQHNNSSKK